jgi:hypothetical protein
MDEFDNSSSSCTQFDDFNQGITGYTHPCLEYCIADLNCTRNALTGHASASYSNNSRIRLELFSESIVLAKIACRVSVLETTAVKKPSDIQYLPLFHKAAFDIVICFTDLNRVPSWCPTS